MTSSMFRLSVAGALAVPVQAEHAEPLPLPRLAAALLLTLHAVAARLPHPPHLLILHPQLRAPHSGHST